MKSYKVRIWEIGKRTIRGKEWYRVRWIVEGETFEELFKTKTPAKSFRMELAKAHHKGEAFDTETGRPVSLARAQNATTWYDHARAYVEMKWPRASANSRRGIVEALALVTVALVRPLRGRPDATLLREGLYRYGLNPRQFSAKVPQQYAEALDWLKKASLSIVELESRSLIRKVLDALSLRLDGKPAAAATIRRKRVIFYNALGYAVELELLASNPIATVQWTAPEVAQAIDRRVVANPAQVAALIEGVKSFGKAAGRCAAFFAVLYYTGARPSEAADLRRQDCELPTQGWGRGTFCETEPHVGSSWTDDGRPHERRGLKRRPRTESRPTMLPPPLVQLLRWHEEEYGLAPDGRFFRGIHGGPLSSSVYERWWKMARKQVLTPAQYASPLARRPYDLRHAAASLWLNAGVPATEVARRLGNSVAVLLKVYANCIDGEEAHLNGRIEEALGIET